MATTQRPARLLAGIVLLTLLVAGAANAQLQGTRGESGFFKTVGTEPGVCAVDSEIIVGPGTTVYYCYSAFINENFTVSYNITDDILGPIGSGKFNAANETLEIIVGSFIDANVTNLAEGVFWQTSNMSNNGTAFANATVFVDPDLAGGGSFNPAIPTLSEVAMFSFGLLLIVGAFFTIRRAG